MKETVDLAAHELEEMDLFDLGDAAEETRQIAPFPLYIDSVYGYGEWSR